MKKVNLINRKNILKGMITGMICMICLFTMSLGLNAQTIQFKGGSCVLDTIVEIRDGFVRADFKYTLEENAKIDALHVLLDKGLLVVSKKKYKATGIVFDVDEQGKISTKKDGAVSLTFFIPDKIKMESLKFVLSEQEPESAKEAIKYAESIDFGNMEVPVTKTLPVKLCYIIPYDGFVINTVDSIDRVIKDQRDPFVLAAGRHHLIGQWFDAAGKMQWNSGPVSAHYEFEEGKCYRIGFSSKLKDVYYEEIVTDTVLLSQAQSIMRECKANIEIKIEKLNEYMAFQKANPNHLDGIWSGEKKRALNTFFMQYTITGNRMLFEGKSKQGNRPFTAEGQLFYNKNTTVLIPEKATAKGNEVEKFSKQPQYVWYYTITNDELHLEGGRLFDNKGFIWENTGDFHKIYSTTN